MCAIYSGQDGTVRVWNIANETENQAFLQQTCVFNGGDEMSSSELDGLLLGHVAWNSTGKLFAAAVDNLINVWQVNGTSSESRALNLSFLFCLFCLLFS